MPGDAEHARLAWRMCFESAAEATRVRAFVIAANEQNVDRLEAVLGTRLIAGPHDHTRQECS